VSRYQKGKINLDFTEARDSEWQWHQLSHMQVCTSLQTDNHANTSPLSFFTGRMPFLPPNQQRQSTEGLWVRQKHKQSFNMWDTVHCRIMSLGRTLWAYQQCILKPINTLYSSVKQYNRIKGPNGRHLKRLVKQTVASSCGNCGKKRNTLFSKEWVKTV